MRPRNNQQPSFVFRSYIGLAAVAVICVLGLLLLACTFPADARAQATIEEILDVTPFSTRDAANVREGKIVSTGLKEVSKRELAVGAACLIKGDAAGRLDEIRDEQRPMFQRKMLKDYGRLDTDAPLESLQTVTLGENAADEASHYLNFTPGVGLNLSEEEIQAFQALKASYAENASVEKVHDLIRRQLYARYASYRQEGLAGMGKYARDRGETTDPAVEVTSTLDIAQPLKSLFPAYYRVWRSYPADIPPGVQETFFWSRLDVDKRPALVLVHRMDAALKGGEIIGERYFYFSRFANVGFAIAALVPVEEGALFFYINRFWIDYWTGMASLKHRMGQRLMSGEMEERMKGTGICR